jgi:DNA repair photolyase
MKRLKSSLVIRGDSLYCPLAFSLDSYGNCEADCVHCFFRRLNHIWGQDLKPMDVEIFHRTLHNGIGNMNPRSPLAWAIALKKTLRFGNKADPFQEAEREHRVSKEALIILRDLSWPTVIETKFTHVLIDYFDILVDMKNHLHIMPIISPGYISDWIVFEYEKTTHPAIRFSFLKEMVKQGFRVGVNGEPFIPGYHTIDQFEDMIKMLKEVGVPSYNVYNLHMNDFVIKRLFEAKVDIERVWEYNKDENWKPILQRLINIAKRYDIILGCPDFVNAGWEYYERSNTCCGLNVDNPCTWNTVTWKRKIQEEAGEYPHLYVSMTPNFIKDVIEPSWDGVGNFQDGIDLLDGKKKDMFNLDDIYYEGKEKKKDGLF